MRGGPPRPQPQSEARWDTPRGGGGGTPIDWVTDNQARQALQNRLKNFGASNCNRVFDEVIEDYSAEELGADVYKTEFYNVSNPRFGRLTQDQVSGNGNTTALGATLAFGDTARTLTGGTDTAVLLGANFFSNSNAVYQRNVLLHELLHADTGWSDDEIFANFRRYGLTNPNGDTEDISAWLSTDCTKTPASPTWWK
jgi:hypothetical protein